MSSEWISTCPVARLGIRSKQERFIVLCLTSNKYTIKEGQFKSPWKPCLGQAFVTRASAAVVVVVVRRARRGSGAESKVAEDFACGGMMQEDMSYQEGWSPSPL